MGTKSIVAVALGTLALVGGVARAEGRVERQDYQIGVSAEAAALSGSGVAGGVVFDLAGDEEWMHVTIDDALGFFFGPMGGLVEFLSTTDPTALERPLEEFWVCGSRSWMAVPEGARHVRVTLDASLTPSGRFDPRNDPIPFHPCPEPAPGTSGEVVAEFL